MATTTEPPDEEKTGAPEPATEPVVDALRQVWLAGLGALAATGQQGERLFHTLVEKGREFEPTVHEHGKKAGQEMKHLASEVGARLKGLAGKAEEALDEKVSAALQRMGFPTKEDLAALSQKIDQLTARLEQMQAERGTTQADQP